MKGEEVVVKVRELMTETLFSVESEETIIRAARLMGEKGISSVLVKRQGELVGIITDRRHNYQSPIQGNGCNEGEG